MFSEYLPYHYSDFLEYETDEVEEPHRDLHEPQPPEVTRPGTDEQPAAKSLSSVVTDDSITEPEPEELDWLLEDTPSTATVSVPSSSSGRSVFQHTRYSTVTEHNVQYSTRSTCDSEGNVFP